MSEISRSKLFSKLDATTFKALESATVFCKLRGNPYVELVHWLFQLKQIDNGDLSLIASQFDLDPARLQADFTAALDALPRGSSSISDLSSHIDEAVERAWTYASVMYGSHKVRTGHILIGALKSGTLRNALLAISREFNKVKVERLTDEFDALLAGSVEAQSSAQGSGAGQLGEASGAMAPGDSKESALAKYAQDLTAKAAKGEIDPVLGRDHEIRQIVDILMRRRQNNPILTGEAGVGKTSVVEGFALRVVKGDVPPQLRGVRICSLDLGALQAGASMKGEFENRLRQVIEEVQSSPTPIILFIDEAHTLIGAGGAAGTGDAANLLKPALARGKLRTIAATTWAEYKKFVEPDAALTRRFQVVKVEEPSEGKAIAMLRGTANVLEKHHRVQLLDEALEAAVKLSKRYIPDRQLPDKAVSLLDTACARVAVSQHAVPPEVEDSRRRIDLLKQELEIIAREQSVGVDAGKRKNDVERELAEEGQELEQLETRWRSEKALVDRILAIRAELRSSGAAPEAAKESKEEPAPPPSLDAADKREASLTELKGLG